MICTKYKIYFGLFALAFLSFCSFSSAFAVSDVTYTFDSSNPVSFSYFCFDNEVSVNVNCSDFQYLKIDFSGTWSSAPGWNTNPYLVLNFSGSTNYIYNTFFYPVPSYIYDISSSDYSAIFTNGLTYSSNLPSDWSLTLTLTNSISPSAPTGTINITENGTYDVSSYATAEVDVPPTTVEGDYHDDLVDIKTGIYVVAGTLLVIYFFYCIYRMIIKSAGGWR